jgi:hypothetical protein
MAQTRLLLSLTIVNLALLAWTLLAQSHAAVAQDAGAGVLRGTGLEIVDAQGRVRASIKLQAAEVFAPTGRRFPETVMLRLIDQHGRPEVKIGASAEGGGLSLVGASDDTQVLLSTERGVSALKLATRESSRTITP